MCTVPQVVFVGMPGSGKTRIGKEVSQILSVPFHDSDLEIESDYNCSVSDFFAQRGQSEFRRIEHDTIKRYLQPCADKDDADAMSGVLSVGGGALTHEDTCQLIDDYMRRGGYVVYLRPKPEDAIENATRSHNKRPLLAQNPYENWMNLYHARHPLFMAHSNFSMLTHGKTPRQAARTVIDMLHEHVIHVSGSEREYDVRIGVNTTQHLLTALGETVVRVALLHTLPVQRHSDKVRAFLRRSGYDVTDIVIPDAEAGKTIQVVSRVWDQLATLGFTRSDAIVSVGGGALTDVAGFIASTWLRGITYVNCPTSLLAMVDASTGGKTGINTEHGKNLVGSFYTPAAVLIDVETLRTLPQDIFIEGLGEVVKAGFIGDRQILSLIEQHSDMLRHVKPEALSDEDMNVVIELIDRSVRVKERHVSQDFTEQGIREFLNYGHTLGHAIEKVEHFTWKHGHAVAVGMVYAAELAKAYGKVDQDFVDYTRSIIASVGLRTSWQCTQSDEVIDLMYKDKKARGRMARFVIVTSVGLVERLEGPDEQILRQTLKKIES